MDIASRASLLRETAEHHDPYETHASRNRWDWHAAYMDARSAWEHARRGIEGRGRYMEEVLHISAL